MKKQETFGGLLARRIAEQNKRAERNREAMRQAMARLRAATDARNDLPELPADSSTARFMQNFDAATRRGDVYDAPSPDRWTVSETRRDPVISRCRIEPAPDVFTLPQVWVMYGDSTTEQLLFRYVPDEVSFTEAELIGLTADESRQLKFAKDRAYLQRETR